MKRHEAGGGPDATGGRMGPDVAQVDAVALQSLRPDRTEPDEQIVQDVRGFEPPGPRAGAQGVQQVARARRTRTEELGHSAQRVAEIPEQRGPAGQPRQQVVRGHLQRGAAGVPGQPADGAGQPALAAPGSRPRAAPAELSVRVRAPGRLERLRARARAGGLEAADVPALSCSSGSVRSRLEQFHAETASTSATVWPHPAGRRAHRLVPFHKLPVAGLLADRAAGEAEVAFHRRRSAH